MEYTCIKIISYEIYLTCDALCDDCFPRSFCYFFFLRSFCHFFFFSYFLNFHFNLKLFLICSYFSGDLSLTVLIKCVLNKKKCIHYIAIKDGKRTSYTLHVQCSYLYVIATSNIHENFIFFKTFVRVMFISNLELEHHCHNRNSLIVIRNGNIYS